MKLLLIFFCSALLFSQSGARAQCCSAGAPSNANCSLSDGGKDLFKISLSHAYSYSDEYYNGTTKLYKSYIDSYFNYTSLNLTYGLTNKLQIIGDLGYFFNKAQKFVLSDYTRYAHGISDLALGFAYNTYQSEDKLFNIYQSFKMTFPIGAVDQKYDNIVLPIDFQPSSGNNKYNFALALAKNFEHSDFSLLSYNSFEISKAIETEFTSHKYGNLYNLSISGVYRAFNAMAISLQARCEIREKALEGNKTVDNVYSYINASGGLNWYIAPQLAYSFKDWQISTQASIPVYKNVNGEQLTNNFMLAFSISKTINFSSGTSETQERAETADSKDNLQKTEVRIEGACDMCKARIEGVANEMKNVTESSWDKDTKILTLYYKDEKPNIDAIEKAMADVGHDNEHYKAKDEVYNKLPKCCLYRK